MFPFASITWNRFHGLSTAVTTGSGNLSPRHYSRQMAPQTTIGIMQTQPSLGQAIASDSESEWDPPL